MEPVTCVACGRDHIDDEDALARSVRIGVSFVADTCAWTLRYPGMEAHEVIEHLEGRLAGSYPATPQEAVTRIEAAVNGGTDARASAHAASDPESDDPAERVATADADLTGRHTIPCPVCGGDGELEGATADEPPVLCARCNGNGTVEVTGG